MASGKLVCEDHYIDAFDKGIRLHVREKRPRGKRFVVIGDGTHYMEFEKRREELYREVENFLES